MIYHYKWDFFFHFVENKNGIRIIKCKSPNKCDLLKHFKICLSIELHMIRPFSSWVFLHINVLDRHEPGYYYKLKWASKARVCSMSVTKEFKTKQCIFVCKCTSSIQKNQWSMKIASPVFQRNTVCYNANIHLTKYMLKIS